MGQYMNNIKYLIRRIIFKLSFFSSFREFMALYSIKRRLNDDDIEKMSKKCGVLESLYCNYRLTDGTALGLYREGGFIPHDDDIDIDILNATDEQIIGLKNKMEMRIVREVVLNKKTQQIAFCDKEGFIFDLVFWYQENEFIFNYCEKGYERIQNIKFFKDLNSINFRGKQYPMPGAIEEWLEMRYGNDWRVPKTYKGDWKEECFDMKKIGRVS